MASQLFYKEKDSYIIQVEPITTDTSKKITSGMQGCISIPIKTIIMANGKLIKLMAQDSLVTTKEFYAKENG